MNCTRVFSIFIKIFTIFCSWYDMRQKLHVWISCSFSFKSIYIFILWKWRKWTKGTSFLSKDIFWGFDLLDWYRWLTGGENAPDLTQSWQPKSGWQCFSSLVWLVMLKCWPVSKCFRIIQLSQASFWHLTIWKSCRQQKDRDAARQMFFPPNLKRQWWSDLPTSSWEHFQTLFNLEPHSNCSSFYCCSSHSWAASRSSLWLKTSGNKSYWYTLVSKRLTTLASPFLLMDVWDNLRGCCKCSAWNPWL